MTYGGAAAESHRPAFGASFKNMQIALELSRIKKSFGNFPALSDAHFSAENGEVHALLGENGAGKSSLMNVAAGLYSPDSGSIKISDIEYKFSGPREAMQQGVGMIHQNFKLVNRFTVVENVLLTSPRGSFRHGKKVIENEIRAKAEALGFNVDPARRVDSLLLPNSNGSKLLKCLSQGRES